MPDLYQCAKCGHVVASTARFCTGCRTPGPLARHPNSWRTAEPPEAIRELLAAERGTPSPSGSAPYLEPESSAPRASIAPTYSAGAKARDERRITLGFVIAWAWAVIAGVPSIMLFEDKAGAGICFILSALVALPPVSAYAARHWRLALSGWLRFAIVFILAVVAGSQLGPSLPPVSPSHLAASPVALVTPAPEASQPIPEAAAATPTPEAEETPGIQTIKGSSWFGCTDKDYFQKLVGYIVDKDERALEAGLWEAGDQCTMFRDGEQVHLEDTAIFSGLIRVRRQGETQEFWTNIEAAK